jgi:PAS domain S-box-containing protein
LARPPEEFDASRSTPETPQGESAADAIPRDSDEHFRSTFEQTAVGIAHVSEDGRWLRVNQKFCDLLGYTKQQIHELNFRDLTHPLDVATQLSQAQQMADGLLDHYSLLKRYIRKDGHSVWVQLTVDAVRDSQRRLKYCVHVAQEGRAALHDHSAQEKLLQAQRDLQIATTYLEMFTNRLSAPLSQYSRDLRYLWVNDNYARWLQRPPDQIIGRPILDVIGKDALDALLPHIDKVLSGHKIAFQQEADFHGIGPRRIAAFYAPTVDTTGAVDGWVALVQEIALSAFVRAN